MRFQKTPFAIAALALSGAVPLAAQTTTATIEAESMTRDANYLVETNRIRLKSPTVVGTASKSFTGSTGTYNMQVYVVPESDGQSTLEVYKGTTLLQKYTYPLTDAATSFTVKNVALTSGQQIKLVGRGNGGAVARVDKIVLTKVAAGTPPDSGTGTPPASEYKGTPYSGTPVALPKAFEAAKFDKGGQGVAYKDLTTGNAGGVFRTAEDVDLVASTDAQGGGYAVNNFQTGEWLAYTVNVPAEGNYDLAIRASNNLTSTTASAFHIEVDGVNVTGSVAVAKTGNWNTYQWFGKQGVNLKAGKHVLKVVSDQQYFNMSAVSVLANTTTTPPPVNSGPTVSLTAPTSGQTVSGPLSYAAVAKDDQAVSKVEFSVSSATPMALGTKMAPPYSGTLDTTKLENGSHTLKAVAYDAQGKTSTAQVSFNVQNGTGGTLPPGGGAKPANLLFWSGFESGVSLGSIYNCYPAGCYQDLLGTDSTTGFSWPPKIGTSSKFQMRSGQQSTPSTIDDWIVNNIQTVTGRTGAPTRAQYSLIKKNSCTGTAGQGGCWTQDPYIIRPASQGDMYISFWRKLQPDLMQKFGGPNWHVLFEWKSTGDYRTIVSIVNYDTNGGAPYWQIKGDNVANGGLPQQEFWKVLNKTVPVPIGQWFKFEVFWHRSQGADGRVWMAVNGETIVDKYGPNIGVNNNPIDRIFLTQLYSGAAYPVYQWTDDMQIWSSFPSAKPGDPWYDGVYAPTGTTAGQLFQLPASSTEARTP
jgi:carbohydrate binding protein with CBM6 domain/Big-like domain-containing protein